MTPKTVDRKQRNVAIPKVGSIVGVRGGEPFRFERPAEWLLDAPA
jgi:hypothetical protein